MPVPIPVTLLTGFLGAGKTTLLNSLLAAVPHERIAIVENEFGAVGIDGSLIAPEASTIVELSNGCICCSVRGELSAALEDLLHKREAGTLQFDRLIIETTGLADPAPVIQTFFWEQTLAEAFRLDAVITLVDVCHGAEQLDREAVAASQVAFADWLILTKTDLQAPGDLSQRLRAINSRADILDRREVAAHWPRMLDTGSFSLNERGMPRKTWTQATPARSAFATNQTRWDDSIESILLESPTPLDLNAISAFVDQLVEAHANDLLRYKGILAIANEPRRLIFQGVHRIAGFDYGRDWDSSETPESRIVLIGRRLPREQIEAQFRQACE